MKVDFGVIFTILAFLIPWCILGGNWVMEYTGLKSNKRKREEASLSFDKVIDGLASENPATQLSAAVLLRRYFTLKIGKDYYLRKETTDVISSILRTVPTGIYQKTLADGLAYAEDLSRADLQRTNLQNVYLGSKSYRLVMHSTDLFMANLSHGLIDNVDANGIILYNSLLYSTTIKNSDFSNANFVGADLSNIRFSGVILKNADFSKAFNVPEEIATHLKDGKYTSDKPVYVGKRTADKSIFFSMPGYMSKEDELTVKAYRQFLLKLGFEVKFYTQDTYPRFGQLSQVKAAIERSCGVVAFGTKQIFIKEGIYRPGMNGEKEIKESWRSTPWNEVEVGMAVMAGLPILLIRDSDIEDGIFDSIISESYMFSLDAKTDVKLLEKNQQFREWFLRIQDITE